MWFLEFLKIVIWPVVVIVLVRAFYPQLKMLISRLKEGKAFGVELMLESFKGSEFESTLSDYMPGSSWLSGQSPPAQVRVELDPRRVASFYFMAHDLTLSWSATVNGAPRAMIAHTLHCAMDHARKIGLGGTPFFTALENIYKDATTSKDEDWTPEKRRIEGRKLWTIARRTGDLLLQAFPDQEAAPQR